MTKKTTVYSSYRNQELVDKCVSKDGLLENFKRTVELRNNTITDLKAQIESLQKGNNYLTTRFNEEYEANKIHTERIKELETKNIELDTKRYKLDTYITDTATESGRLKTQNHKLIDSLCSLIKQGER